MPRDLGRALTLHPSPNHDARDAAIDMVILHYTAMADAGSALEVLSAKRGSDSVSSHYLVARDGAIYRLVAEERRAWHAGKSQWLGRVGTNARSIGIEIDNPGPDAADPAFGDVQIAAVIDLCAWIIDRHAILPNMVLGHSDVAIGRKIDPGVYFPWASLAAKGVGLWPNMPVATRLDGTAVDAADLRADLTRFGYDGAHPLAIEAFQRHFRPERVDGHADRGSQAILAALLDAMV